ncbi:hypothetical protein Q2T83_12020 [Fervidibacter sacchari]|uniref:Uncharacterized protein n=1 Tax=Candidatus Fervidibacter sacchari TaxID=1448929 RepID=A0ABT2EMZ3_9BACT|nr:hypothetical protein [Candidatus Fervidibacter sacchari]MCS3919323.1 hypothetical protein [Candidatus Fervidibacter sacchari]WKU15061.1 hypothetical protein Q2T83_12020 [Candidatus Fervidibacter sacchari]
MAEKRKRKSKPKIVGTMVVDGKEIPVIGWIDPEKTRRKWRQLSRKEKKDLEREWKEVVKLMNRAKGSLLEVLIQQRNALRGWGEEE